MTVKAHNNIILCQLYAFGSQNTLFSRKRNHNSMIKHDQVYSKWIYSFSDLAFFGIPFLSCFCICDLLCSFSLKKKDGKKQPVWCSYEHQKHQKMTKKFEVLCKYADSYNGKLSQSRYYMQYFSCHSCLCHLCVKFCDTQSNKKKSVF